MAAHRYWQIICLTNDFAGSFWPGFAECELATSPGGTNLVGSGTATASGIDDGVASNAADGNPATNWGGSRIMPQWWSYDLGSAQAITEIRLQPYSGTPERTPRTFSVWFSDNGVTWTKTGDFSSAVWVAGVTQVFTVTPPTGDVTSPHRYWRLSLLSTAGGAYVLGEVQFLATSGVPLAFSGGTASASSTYSGTYSADKATDGSSSTYWNSSSAVPPQWWKYDYGAGSGIAVKDVAITAPTADTNQTPTSFDLEYSDDDSTWFTARSLRCLTPAWSSGETRTFTLDLLAPPATGAATRMFIG